MTVNAALEDRPLDVVVGRNVHILMWERRMTQAELGTQIGMDQSSLGKRLRGERGWSLDQVALAARALGTTVAYLVGETYDREQWWTKLPADESVVHPLGLEPRTHWSTDDSDLAPIIPIDWIFEHRENQRLGELVGA